MLKLIQSCISVFLNRNDFLSRRIAPYVAVCICMMAFTTDSFAGAKERKADSLKGVLATQRDTSRVLTLVKLSQAMLPINKDSALYYALMLKDEALVWGKQERICDAYVILGTCYHHLQKEDSAMMYKRRGLAVGVNSNYARGEANAANDIGLYLKEKGDLDSAIIYILRATRIREKSNDEKALGSSYTNLALLYYTQQDFANAMLYYRKAEMVFAKFGLDDARALVLNNLAAIYDENKQYDSSLFYYQIALDIRESQGDSAGISQTKINMGVTYRNRGDFVTAERLFLEALEIKEKIGDIDGEATACLDLAENARLMKKYAMSETYIVRADSLSGKVEQKELRRDVYKVYADLYSETGRPALALDYFRKYHKLADEILGEEKFRTIQELQTRYESEKKERENVQLREQARIAEEARVKDEQQKRFLLIGLALLVAVLGVAFYAYRVKIKSNKLLADKNEQISRQNAVLKELNKKLIDSEEELTALNTTKDKLFSVISHDLGNPVNALVNYNNVLRNQKEAMTRDELVKSLDKIQVTVQSLQGFLENLLHWSVQQQSGIRLKKENVLVSHLIHEVVDLFAASSLAKQLNVETKVADTLSVSADRNAIQLIVRNLFANAVKFSSNSKTVVISASISNAILKLEVIDQGVGLSQDVIAKILSGKEIVSGRGTNAEGGTGIGLNLVREYIKLLEGKLEIESKPNERTVFRVMLPV